MKEEIINMVKKSISDLEDNLEYSRLVIDERLINKLKIELATFCCSI